jgi:hypothetical protein
MMLAPAGLGLTPQMAPSAGQYQQGLRVYLPIRLHAGQSW